MSKYITLQTIHKTPKGQIVKMVNTHPNHLETAYVVHEWGVDDTGTINTQKLLVRGRFETLTEAREWLQVDISPKSERVAA